MQDSASCNILHYGYEHSSILVTTFRGVNLVQIMGTWEDLDLRDLVYSD